jgi:hypothetical protein
MQNRRLDVLEILEREKEYHLEQIKRINIALSALKGELPQNVVESEKTPLKRRKVQWKIEIDKLFEISDVLTVDEIQQQLVEKGIDAAEGAKAKSAITTTLIRKAKKGELKKIRTATFGVIKESNNKTDGIESFDQI